MRKEIFAENEYYHVYNRRVDRTDLFLNDADRTRFVHTLYVANNFQRIPQGFNLLQMTPRESLMPRSPLVEVAAACLMPNHYHLVIRPLETHSVSTFFHKVGVSYTKYFNKQYSRSGRLFESTFRAKHIARDAYAMYLTKYIHFNPTALYQDDSRGGTREELIAKLEQYPWSTFSDYLGGKSRFALLVSLSFRDTVLGMDSGAYRSYVRELVDFPKYKA